MSSLLLAALSAWLFVGIAGVTLLHHRGHDVFSWSLLFVFLGPLAVPVAVSAQRHLPAQPDWAEHAGDLDVLVAHDGSAEADAALRASIKLLGDRVTSVTLAAVVDVEAASTVRGEQTCRDAQARLEATARRCVADHDVALETVVLFGEADRVLPAFAQAHGYELVVRGDRLAKRSAVPVLLGAAQ